MRLACGGKDLDLHHVFVSTYCVPVCKLLSLRKKTCHYAVRHSLHLLIFFPYSLQAFQFVEVYTLAATCLQSTLFASLKCHHFCTTQPTLTYLIKNNQLVNSLSNFDSISVTMVT